MLMKVTKIKFSIYFALLFFSFLSSPVEASAQGSSTLLSGRILLQVEKNGQAWYVDPIGNARAFLGRPADAFRVMRGFGLGVSDNDMARIRQSTVKRSSLSGRILIQVEAKGAAFYVNPTDLSLYYLGRPADAFQIMRKLALGISDKDLKGIAVDSRYDDVVAPETVQTAAFTSSASTTATTTVISTSSRVYVSNTQ
ncbi:hypothetical protein HGA64_05585, partial [Candidatus Falkowbacteria bacterium]|nr:hypothetical protein [Candidatus Falkowbacteria bacterium]